MNVHDRAGTSHNAASVSGAPAIACLSLSKTYDTMEGGTVVALEQIELTVPAGAFLSVVGPSGCGKSTLLKLLAGLIPATTGEARLFDRRIAGPSLDVGVVFQAATLLEWRSVLENVMLPIDVLGLDRRVGRERALMLIKMMGLDGFERKYPGELSGGMQQRVAIARALVHDPGVLLMDEPFGALDAMTRETMNLELQRIWRESGKTIILITHSISEAVFLGDRVAVMTPRPGRLIDLIDVELTRPRELAIMGTAEFGGIVNHIRQVLDAGTAAD